MSSAESNMSAEDEPSVSKLKCYGQISGPSYLLRQALDIFRAKNEKALPELACWILEFVAKESVTAASHEHLYSRETIACLRQCLEKVCVVPGNSSTGNILIPLIAKMFEEMPLSELSQESVDEINQLAAAITSVLTRASPP